MPEAHPGSLATGARVRPLANPAQQQHLPETIFDEACIPRDALAGRERAALVIRRRARGEKGGAGWE
ncbi:MAG: hypothetical protein LAN84_13015 [Acidobacteriia bacterium]|nr:hypothetical protein [Terriglobia bacterium]